MKHPNRLLYIITIFTTIICLWKIPQLIEKATITPTNYPFAYYSSILKKLCFIDLSDKSYAMVDIDGQKYNTTQFDTLLPLLNYRQLLSEGLLPDSLFGYEITPKFLMSKSVICTFRPSKFSSPEMGLHGLLEAMPLRGGLALPQDVFRIKDQIEFINATTNSVDNKKSLQFSDVLKKKGFCFPSQWAIGDANTRKAYDEGYFILDNNSQLFHIKMVNDRPYVRNTMASEKIDIAHYASYNATDKRFYGFIFSKEGKVYILEGDQGHYFTTQLEIPNIDLTKDRITIMGNLMYWNVSITNDFGKTYHTLDAQKLQHVHTHTIKKKANTWDLVRKWFIPISIQLEHKDSLFIYPTIQFGSTSAFAVNIFLGIALLFLLRRRNKSEIIFKFIITICTGIMGLIPALILPKFK